MAHGTVQIVVNVNDSQLSGLSVDLNKIEGSADKAGRSLKDMFLGSTAANLVTSGIAAVGGAIKGLVGDAVSASDSIDKFNSTMKFAGFGNEEIKKATASMQDYADKTVYDLNTVSNTTAQLAANGIKDYTGLTQAAGNLNAVAGGNAETFKSVGMMLTQTAGAGKLTTENWNQLADAIPGASGMLQEAMKKNGAYTGNFRDAMEKGEITADEFNKAIMDLGMTDAAKEAATSTKTFEGAFGALEANVVSGIKNVIDAIGKGNLISVINNFSDVVAKAFEFLVEKINQAKEVFKDIAAFVQENAAAFKILGGVVIAVVSGFIAFQSVVGIMNGVSTAITGVKTAFGLMKAAILTNPFALVIAGIVALAAGFVYFYKTNETFRNKVNEIAKAASSLIGPIDKVIAGLKLLWDGFKAIFNFDMTANVSEIKKQFTSMFPESIWNAMTKVANGLRIIKENASDLIKAGLGALKETFGNLADSFGNSTGKIDLFSVAIQAIKSAILAMLGPVGLVIKAFELFAKVIGGGDISKGISTIFSSVQSLATGIATYGPQLGSSFGTALQGILGAIAAALPGIIAGALQVIAGFVTGIAQGLPTLALAAGQLILAFTSAIILLIPTIAASGLLILTTLTNAIVASIFVIAECVTRIIVALITALTVHLPEIIAAGTGLLTALIAGITQVLPQLISTGANLITTFLTSLTEKLPGIIEAGMNLLIAFLQGVASKIGMVTQAALDVMLNFLNALASRMPDIVNTAVTLIVNFVNTLAGRMPDIIGAAVNLMVQFLEGLASKMPDFIGAVVDLITAFLKGIAEHIGEIVDAGMDIVDAIVDGILQAQDRLINAATDLINGLAENIRKNEHEVKAAALNLLDAIVGVFVPDALFNAGKDLITGLWNGIDDMVGWLSRHVDSLFGEFVDSVKDFFSIGSPSKLFADEIGEMLPAGVAVGVKANTGEALSALKSMNQQIMKSELRGVTAERFAGIESSRVSSNAAASAISTNTNETKTIHNEPHVTINVHVENAEDIEKTINDITWRDMASLRGAMQ